MKSLGYIVALMLGFALVAGCQRDAALPKDAGQDLDRMRSLQPAVDALALIMDPLSPSNGIIIRSDGLMIATAAGLSRGKCKVALSDGAQCRADILLLDEVLNFALLKVNADHALPAVPISLGCNGGQRVVALTRAKNRTAVVVQDGEILIKDINFVFDNFQVHRGIVYAPVGADTVTNGILLSTDGGCIGLLCAPLGTDSIRGMVAINAAWYLFGDEGDSIPFDVTATRRRLREMIVPFSETAAELAWIMDGLGNNPEFAHVDLTALRNSREFILQGGLGLYENEKWSRRKVRAWVWETFFRELSLLPSRKIVPDSQ